MADIFISYARDEHAEAEKLRLALEALGLDVFMDVERLDAGEVFTDVIEREIKSASAVIGVWSPHALSRPWVRTECDIANRRKVLLPVIIEPIGELDTPAAFWNMQHIDLTQWDGAHDDPNWRKLLRALGKTLGRTDLIKADNEVRKKEARAKQVEAELAKKSAEMERLREEKKKLEGPRRKRTGTIAVGLAAIATTAASGAWFLGKNLSLKSSETARQETIAALISPNVIEALDQIKTGYDVPTKYEGENNILAQVLIHVSVPQLENAGRNGNHYAMMLAAWAYREGKGGVLENKVKAKSLYELSCNAGVSIGCAHLASMFETGDGIRIDIEKAENLYDESCEFGEELACQIRQLKKEQDELVKQNQALQDIMQEFIILD